MLYGSKKYDIKNNLLITKSSKFIQGHHADYDKYLNNLKKNTKKYNFKYFVFLDQDAPNHSDLKRMSRADVDEKVIMNLCYFFLKN